MRDSAVLRGFQEMKGCQSLLLIFVLWGGWLPCSTVADNHGLGCRTLRFAKPVDGIALQGHVIKDISRNTENDKVLLECRVMCLYESTCVSINIGPPASDGARLCQLSNSDHIRHPEDLKPQEGFIYWVSKDPCTSYPCLHNATCLNGFIDKRYICLCQAGYTGEHCETAVECTSYSSLTSADRKTTYKGGDSCDYNLNGWYRFQGSAGTRMPTSCTPIRRCNTAIPGWLNGGHPTVADGKVTRQVCFRYYSNCCQVVTNIQVRNCGSFYVYHFYGTPACPLRYCGTD